MEKIAEIITSFGFCSFPRVEAVKLFKLTIFNFLVGNEDMHLKNFSLISRDRKITLSPGYDLLNSTIAQMNAKEELALPLNGKKNNLKRSDFIDYFAIQRLQLNKTVILDIMSEIKQALPAWKVLISNSFLSATMKKKYIELLEERSERIII